MLKKIIGSLKKQHALKDSKGVFLSYFDNKGILLGSHGVLVTDRDLGSVVRTIYNGMVKKHEKIIERVICDVVITTKTLQSLEDIKTVDLKKEGLSISSLDYTKSGVMLPQTQGVKSISHMIQSIKEKNNIKGNTIIHSFTTDKTTITL